MNMNLGDQEGISQTIPACMALPNGKGKGATGLTQ